MKGSRGWYDTKHLIRREYEKLANRRRAKANQAYHDITKGRKLIVIQDEYFDVSLIPMSA